MLIHQCQGNTCTAYLATVTAPPHHQLVFDLFQVKVDLTVDIEGPGAAAQLCDRKACEVEEFLLKANDAAAQTLQAAGLMDVTTVELEAWARRLRQQSRALRRRIAIT